MDNENNIELKNIIASRKIENDKESKVTKIEIRLNKTGNVIIVGQLNNRGYCWCSITNIADEISNEQIFNYLTTNNFCSSVTYFTSISDALKEKMITEEELEFYYLFDFKPLNTGENEWQSKYGTIKDLHNTYKDYSIGKDFAKNLKNIFSRCQVACECRLCNNEYINILNNYSKTIEEIPYTMYQASIAPINMILINESYLRMSNNEAGALAYINCMRKICDKYNIYMNMRR